MFMRSLIRVQMMSMKWILQSKLVAFVDHRWIYLKDFFLINIIYYYICLENNQEY